MTDKLLVNIKWLIISLLLITGLSEPLFSQTKISGVINKYGRVTSKGIDYVVINDETQFDQFAAGDTVLLIQMKGAGIYADESISFGDPYFSYGMAGKHEFLTVLSVDDVTNTIVFRNNIVNSSIHLPSGVQIVKVPSYNSVVVDSDLTCQPWDSVTKTGGILAAIIGRTISLNANIDVTGKGFKGGALTLGKGICATTNIVAFDKYAYPAATDSAGFKGEGLAVMADRGIPPYIPVYPLLGKGKGKIFNGGGGGNGKFSGGGGGSNYGKGGTGGRELATCVPPYSVGGDGGYPISSTGLAGGMFLGGGGGSSTYMTGGTPTPGGNGGGIVLLLCDTLKGNNHSIIADGVHPGTANGEAGSGGGGGGGTIAVYLQSYSANTATSALTISARGGQGGNHQLNSGNGGGGGGGFVTTNNISKPANVTKTVSGGTYGTRPGGTSGATAGAVGVDQTTFVPLLNGFLFNSIRSSVTGDQIDSICSNQVPKPVTGTLPVGGSGDYTYLWQKSYNLLGPESVITGATAKDYTPTVPEANTFWIRRIIIDNGTSLTDTSKWVNIIVQPAITGNLVGKDTTICYNQNPLSLIPLNSGPSNGNGIYQYQWKQNNDDANWTTSPDASGAQSDLASFDPPALTIKTYYQRVVTSGRCIDYSATVTIDVLPLITGNVTTRPDSVICEGFQFNVLGASAPGGGSGSYLYQWQDSTSSGTWQPALGVNTNQTHSPDTSRFAVTEQRFFRRVVFSGDDNVCRDNSSPILLTRFHKIENNIIGSDQTICSGSSPAQLVELLSVTGGAGAGTYTYQWQDSSKTATWTNRSATRSPFAPPALSDSTWYRRIVNSDVCTSTSKKIVVNVHDPIVNNTIEADTTVCSGADPGKLRGRTPAGGVGSFTYQWYSSTDNFSSVDNPIAVSGTSSDYDPPVLTVPTWYRRKAVSGMCETKSNILNLTVLPSISNNVITPDKPEVCFNTVPGQIAGTPLTGGTGNTQTWAWQNSTNGGASWADISGANQQSYTPAASLTRQTWYRRIIKSGPFDCCIDTSAVISIDTLKLPTAQITTISDTAVCSGTPVRLKVHLTGAKNWDLTYLEGSTPVTVNDIPSADYSIYRSPAAGNTMETINYSLSSVVDNNGCLATSLTGGRKADVYRVPSANAGPDDSICGPEYTLAAVPSDGTGLWYFPAQVLESAPTAYNSAIKIDSSFTAPSVSYKFYWEETNWQCVKKDSVTITFYNRIDAVNAGRDTSLMSFDYLIRLKAGPILSYEKGKWSVVTGYGDFDNDSSNETDVRNISLGLNTYKWTVTNGDGICTLEDLVNVNIMSLVIPQGISPNGDLVNDSLVINGLDLVNQIAELSIVNGAGTQVFSTSNRNGGKWQNWDGKNSQGAELPEGTYYYMLKVTSPKTEITVPKSGFIILRRK